MVVRVVTAPVRPEPERDQWGRYVIPNPRTGKRQSWTRATTYSSSIADTFGLTRWQIRMTALGLVRRKDLYAGVAAIADPETTDGKKKLDALCDAAKEFAGTSQAATLGTALHAFAQQVDMGRSPEIPAPWDADIAIYKETLKEQGIETSPNYVERIVVLPDLKVAGTMDRIVRWNGRLMIGDIKTGADLSYSWPEIAIQLAIYSRAETMFDVELNQHFPLPKVDRRHALVVHLPAGQARCTLYLIDIDAGWRTAHLCTMVRDWRTRKDIAHTLEAVVAAGAMTEGVA